MNATDKHALAKGEKYYMIRFQSLMAFHSQDVLYQTMNEEEKRKGIQMSFL
jgi:hypothetical protein